MVCTVVPTCLVEMEHQTLDDPYRPPKDSAGTSARANSVLFVVAIGPIGKHCDKSFTTCLNGGYYGIQDVLRRTFSSVETRVMNRRDTKNQQPHQGS